MAVSPDTAQDLIKELYLMGRAMRFVLLHPEEGQLLPGGVGVLGTLETKGPCRQVDLAVDLCISPSALSRHVTELVAEGYISRHADPVDGRASLIHITGEGVELLRRVRNSRARGLQSALADWSEDDAEHAYLAIQRLRTALTAHAHQSVPAHRSDARQSQEDRVRK
ncbi:MarR family winged helix-turn-helix transcriptional regulator [Nocardia arizonensis]|uniref:MarR family winged helix-turn-helix transcriptional regulator n=1 Tax=Nocardia arizonensis TaxID=1141647 RepID=UPI0006D2A0BE|nr:MarR family transcriptional regulator [Nocardia arizonensis]